MPGKTKILIVDDSDVILNSLKTFFEDFDFNVITSSDGLDGIQKTAEVKPDLIILDLMMPNFDGIKMLQVKKVLKDIRNIPVLVISANTARSNVLAALEAGADKVISKPIDDEELKRNVNELLGGNNFSSINSSSFSSNDKSEIKNKLAEFFIESFQMKKEMIKSALREKNENMLRMAVHEIKGAGGTIGYPELTELSSLILEKEYNNPSDWLFAEIKCNQIFLTVDQIKRLINT
ncbi:MAG: response regulator [Melioribacteraceae bacterium]|nr:response regulator [Melioribacteraceae bacterium]